MGIFRKEENYTEKTIGIITGFSVITINNAHLPIAEYEVSGKKYKVRVPYDIAVKLEKASNNKTELKKVDYNFMKFQMTKILGSQVTIMYNPDKPNKAKVID